MKRVWLLLIAGLLCACGRTSETTYSEGVFRGDHDRGGMLREHKRDATERIEIRGCSYQRPWLVEAYRPVHESITYYYCKISMQNRGGRANASASLHRVDLAAYEYGFAPRLIRVQRGDRVIIAATSKDVPHGIEISGYGVRIPVRKGSTREIHFIARKTGEFAIQCPECMRQGHADMQAKLVVTE